VCKACSGLGFEIQLPSTSNCSTLSFMLPTKFSNEGQGQISKPWALLCCLKTLGDVPEPLSANIRAFPSGADQRG